MSVTVTGSGAASTVMSCVAVWSPAVIVIEVSARVRISPSSIDVVTPLAAKAAKRTSSVVASEYVIVTSKPAKASVSPSVYVTFVGAVLTEMSVTVTSAVGVTSNIAHSE